MPEIVVSKIESAVRAPRKLKPRRVKFPLFGSDGPKIDLTNEQIYELIEFP